MGVFRIRGTVAVVAAVLLFLAALAAGAPTWAALVIAFIGGPTISGLLLTPGPLARAADRSDQWLETPQLPRDRRP